MRTRHTLWLTLPLLASANADLLPMREVRIGSPTMSYRDPEFLVTRDALNVPQALIAWYDQTRGIRISQMNLATGGFVDSVGQLVGFASPITTTAAGVGTYNGPEWGLDSSGPTVYFSGPDPAGVMQIFRHRAGLTAQVTTAGDSPTGNLRRGGNIATAKPSAGDTRVLYFLDTITSGRFAWRVDGQPATERELVLGAVGSSGPRWLPDASTLAVSTPVGNFNQIALYDTRTPDIAPVPITTDPRDKSDAFFFHAPERGGTLTFFVTVAGAAADGGDAIAVYEQVQGNTFKRTNVIDVPALTFPGQGASFFSAEPFFLAGRTFLSVAVTTQSILLSPASIWVISLDGTQVFEVSGPEPKVRIDPEVVVSGDRAFVYYYTQPGSTGGISELYVSEFTASIANCRVDLNNDGFIDFTDFDLFVESFESGMASADFNGDTFLDFTDFDAFVTKFDTGC